MKAESLFESSRLKLPEAIELTKQSLLAHAINYRDWIIAYSGGKDSSATLTIILHLIETGEIPEPHSLTVFYADTRLEILPLQICALGVLREVEARGFSTRIVTPPIDDRFFVYMFGRGVPPSSNTFRWCTPQLKVEPMERAQMQMAVALGYGEMIWSERYRREVYRGFGKEKLLTITGVRRGESAARDDRISISCSRDGAECGQGWLQRSTREGLNDTLAPLDRWRVCNVWNWLRSHAPAYGFPTRDIAETYGGDEAEEIAARTGCVGCPLASRDVALDIVIKQPAWAYLAPLKRLRPLYWELKKPHNRIRKPGGDRRKDGQLASNQQRMGPLVMEARLYGLNQVLEIQEEINDAARDQGRPEISLINEVEHARILELIALGIWPDGWDGTEPRADVLLDKHFNDGSQQPLLIAG